MFKIIPYVYQGYSLDKAQIRIFSMLSREKYEKIFKSVYFKQHKDRGKIFKGFSRKRVSKKL
jgi:hypothetical protein